MLPFSDLVIKLPQPCVPQPQHFKHFVGFFTMSKLMIENTWPTRSLNGQIGIYLGSIYQKHLDQFLNPVFRRFGSKMHSPVTNKVSRPLMRKLKFFSLSG